MEGDTRVEVGIGKEGPSQQLASVDMLQQCDKAALARVRTKILGYISDISCIVDDISCIEEDGYDI